jgi:hypothetical protein
MPDSRSIKFIDHSPSRFRGFLMVSPLAVQTPHHFVPTSRISLDDDDDADDADDADTVVRTTRVTANSQTRNRTRLYSN